MADSKLASLMPRVPATEYYARRTLKSKRSLNDLVEAVHLLILDDEEIAEEYLSFLDATYNSQAVEGSLTADDYCAARMLRDKARKVDNNVVGALKYETIKRVLNVVLRRYDDSRKQRRIKIGEAE